jgi:hypothetical protein
VFQGTLICFKIEFPAVEIRQLQIADVVDLQEGVKVFEQIQEIFFFQYFFGEVGNLSKTAHP